MDNYLEGAVKMTFIRGGIAKSGRPYLQVSNGRAELFLNIPKNAQFTDETVAEYEEGDEIEVNVRTLPGSDSVTFMGIV